MSTRRRMGKLSTTLPFTGPMSCDSILLFNWSLLVSLSLSHEVTVGRFIYYFSPFQIYFSPAYPQLEKSRYKGTIVPNILKSNKSNIGGVFCIRNQVPGGGVATFEETGVAGLDAHKRDNLSKTGRAGELTKRICSAYGRNIFN